MNTQGNKKIVDYALAVDDAIKQNLKVKEYLQHHLDEFCKAAEERISKTLPIITNAVAIMMKNPIPYEINQILKTPNHERTLEQAEKLQKYENKNKLKCPKGYKQLCQKAWWASVSPQTHKLLCKPFDKLTKKQKEKVERHREEYKKPKNCPGGYKFGNERIYFEGYIKSPPEGYGVNCCLPIEPVNPIGWFPGFEGTYENYFDSLNAEEEKTRNAVVLAVVHDYGCTRVMKIKDRIIFKGIAYNGEQFNRDKFLCSLWSKIMSYRNDYDALINQGLENLKANTDKNKKPRKRLAETIRDVLKLNPALKNNPKETLKQVNKMLKGQGWGDTTMDVFKNSPGWKNRHKKQAK